MTMFLSPTTLLIKDISKLSILLLAAIFLIISMNTVDSNAISAVRSQEEGQKLIALTFDDGPHGTLTPQLLDTLKTKNAKATFFVM